MALLSERKEMILFNVAKLPNQFDDGDSFYAIAYNCSYGRVAKAHVLVAKDMTWPRAVAWACATCWG